ncbi:MAG: hypothetical protein VB859_03825 [Planctomycetaceae bacterium]
MALETKLPPLYAFVKNVSVIFAVLGCILGTVITVQAFSMFKLGFMFGIMAVSPGLSTVVGSLLALGIISCFLSSVKAQIETRNAVVLFVHRSSPTS